MMPDQTIINLIRTAITALIGKKFADSIPLEHPEESRGDYASAVAFKLTKLLKEKPDQIAKNIVTEINTQKNLGDLVEKVEAVGPFINFWLSKKYLTMLVGQILKAPAKYGTIQKKKPLKIVVEFSGVNIGKPFGIGHLRSTVNGAAIANILETTGNKVVRVNYLGDWGTLFGKLITGFKHWGKKAALDKDTMQELQRVYIKFHDQLLKNPKLLDEARNWFLKLENNDPEALKQWRVIRAASLKNAKEIYQLLGTKFDDLEDGESRYRGELDKIIKLLRQKKLLKKSQGATIIDLSHEKLPPVLVERNDEASLYATREIAAAITRQKKYKFDVILHEVGIEQELHFRQIITVLKKMGFKWADHIEHIKHGHYALAGQRLRSRAGKTADMKQLLQEAIVRAKKVIQKKNPTLKNKEKVATQVGIGAVKYHDLSQNRLTNIEFDFDRMLSLEGNSAPYLQYTYARIQSVLDKAKVDLKKIAKLKFEPNVLVEPEEQILLRRLVRYPEVVEEAAQKRLPHLIATELYELASCFNLFYGRHQVIKAEEQKCANRLILCAVTAIILKNGLALLGIETPEHM